MAESAILDLPGAPVHLGKPIVIYHQDFGSHMAFAIRLLFWLFLIASGIFLIWTIILPEGAVIGFIIDVAVIYFASRLMAPRLYNYVVQWRDVAVEYTDGIAYLHQSAWSTFRWDEIVEVAKRSQLPAWNWLAGGDPGCLIFIVAVVVGRSREFIICAEGADAICVGGTLAGVDELMKTVQERIHKSREERTPTMLQAG
jgi:hypothetical protein